VNVHDLTPGTYVYNALRNQVRRTADLPSIRLSALFGQQRWADEAAVVCVLCCSFRKMAWKYTDQSAFNSLLIESGHIAQNMLVCAAAFSLGGVPTNALDQSQLEQHLLLDFPEDAALYAVGLGHKDQTCSDDHYCATSVERLAQIIESGAAINQP